MTLHPLLLALLVLAGCSSQPESKPEAEPAPQPSGAEDSLEVINPVTYRHPDAMKEHKLLDASGYPIAFYNVENLFDTIDDPGISDGDFTPEGDKAWDEKRYHKKLTDLGKVLSSIDDEMPVLIGLSEVENKGVIEDLIAVPAMQQSDYGVIHEESPDTRGIDVALIYDKQRFAYQEHESIRIDFPWDENIKTRDILHVTGHFNDGFDVHIFVNHWPSRRDGANETEAKRMEVAGKLRQKIDQIFESDPAARIVIVGDFNDTPTDNSIRDVLGAKFETPVADNQLFNASYELSTEPGMGSHAHEGDWAMLDQVICSGAFINATDGYRLAKHARIFDPNWILYERHDGNLVPNKTFGGDNYYGGYSDHLPVYTVLE